MDTTKTIMICIIAAVAIPILIILLGLVNLRYTEEHSYKCKKCCHEFDIDEGILNSFRAGISLYVKCPKCGKYSAVKTIKKKSRIDS